MDNQRRIQHLYLRAGFGANITQIRSNINRPPVEVTREIFRASEDYTQLKSNETSMLPSRENMQSLSEKERRQIQKNSRREILDLNIQWLMKMITDESFLREKMTLFWHGHFACRTRVPQFCLKQNSTIRQHALGNFKELLHSISKDTAMLQFLNNQQNRKDSPNENFARELLELFTIGKGNYTEQDVKEAARAFTGWGFDRNGDFRFRNSLHDNGEKSFLDETGRLSGEDILDIILSKKQTAQFITRKIYKYFVNEEADEGKIVELADYFYESNYNIGKLMKKIFVSDWFYEEKNVGSRIRSPIELIAGIARSFHITFQNPLALGGLQRSLGQVLFNPPNVGGWPGGKAWIDSTSLMVRMKMPGMILGSPNSNVEIGSISERNDVDTNSGLRRLGAKADLRTMYDEFKESDDSKLIARIAEFLLQGDLSEEKIGLLQEFEIDTNVEQKIASTAINIASLPEYQLC